MLGYTGKDLCRAFFSKTPDNSPWTFEHRNCGSWRSNILVNALVPRVAIYNPTRIDSVWRLPCTLGRVVDIRAFVVLGMVVNVSVVIVAFGTDGIVDSPTVPWQR